MKANAIESPMVHGKKNTDTRDLDITSQPMFATAKAFASGRIGKKLFTAAFFMAVASYSHASLQLDSSVVIVEQSDGEGVISLTNTAKDPVLLHSEIHNVEEDQSDLLLVATPITRVEGGDKQTVRFILKETEPLTTERLKRATFEGIPQTEDNKVRITVRQNIPVIIRPKGLKENKEPWKLLAWQKTAEGFAVTNAGPYVVRMSGEVLAQPKGIKMSMSRNYILPGETIALTSQEPYLDAERIKYTPASVNGYLVGSLEAPIEGARP